MLNTISIILLAFMQAALFGTFSHLLLTGEKTKKQYSLIWSGLCIWTVFSNLFLMKNTMTQVLQAVIFYVIWSVILYLGYQEPILFKVNVLVALTFSRMVAVALYCFLMPVIGRKAIFSSEASFDQIGRMVVIWVLQFLISLVVMIVVQYAYKKKSIRGMIPMFLLPVSQLFYMLGALKVDYIANSTYGLFLIAGQILGCGISLYWLYWVCAENRQKELEAKMKDMQETIEKEKAHFTEIEQRRETLNNLRQGMNLQIQDVQQLMEEKKREEAVKILDELTEMLHSTKEYTFCPVPIINAVLEEKGKECKELGIKFDAEIKIPYNSGITEMAYCSIFSNLMDNAIRGAKEFSEEQKVPGFVRISAIYEGGFCIIKTVNNSKKPDKKPRKGHGKGTVILKEIAEYYGGTYEGTFADDTFTALVTLKK